MSGRCCFEQKEETYATSDPGGKSRSQDCRSTALGTTYLSESSPPDPNDVGGPGNIFVK